MADPAFLCRIQDVQHITDARSSVQMVLQSGQLGIDFSRAVEHLVRSFLFFEVNCHRQNTRTGARIGKIRKAGIINRAINQPLPSPTHIDSGTFFSAISTVPPASFPAYSRPDVPVAKAAPPYRTRQR
jgi:hypothetical protein